MPTNRGFDSFLGYVDAFEGYYDKRVTNRDALYDFWNGTEILPFQEEYSTVSLIFGF